MSFVLINARPSPFGRKVAIALIEKGLEFSVKYDLPWSDGSCTADYNPLAQLPILIAEDGETVYDSAYILTWLEALHPEPALLPSGTELVLAAKKRQLLGERLMETAQGLIFEHQREQPSEAWAERQTRKVLGALATLEELYTDRPAPGPDAMIDHGDIAVATTVLLFEFAVADSLSPPLDALVWRGRYRALTRFVEQIETRPSFEATRPASMPVDLAATIN